MATISLLVSNKNVTLKVKEKFLYNSVYLEIAHYDFRGFQIYTVVELLLFLLNKQNLCNSIEMTS